MTLFLRRLPSPCISRLAIRVICPWFIIPIGIAFLNPIFHHEEQEPSRATCEESSLDCPRPYNLSLPSYLGQGLTSRQSVSRCKTLQDSRETFFRNVRYTNNHYHPLSDRRLNIPTHRALMYRILQPIHTRNIITCPALALSCWWGRQKLPPHLPVQQPPNDRHFQS